MYFLLAGDVERAAESFHWFFREFPDDMGEPIFLLYSAIAARRTGELVVAETRLLKAMLSNLHMLPALIGERVDTSGVWEHSNWASSDYLKSLKSFLDEPTPEERSWVRCSLTTDRFQRALDGYVKTYTTLAREKLPSKRSSVLSQWRKLRSELIGAES